MSNRHRGMSEEQRAHILANEKRALERVFRRLANFDKKKIFLKETQQLKKKCIEISKQLQDPSSKVGKGTPDEGALVRELKTASRRKNELQAKAASLSTLDHKISVSDLKSAIGVLGVRKTTKELEHIVWMVDENLDGMVDWEEFTLMFERNITDDTPQRLEPSGLFNMVQFMMFDEDNSGAVTVDETMTMIYQRYGKDNLLAELTKLFGKERLSGKDVGSSTDLSFSEYLKAVEKQKHLDIENGQKMHRRGFA